MMFGALKTRDYRLLWMGQAISHLGDQFHLIALPWLVLTLTHDPFQLGLVLALAGVPRAAVMLFGGAFADRHSPRLIMLVSDALRFVIAAALAASFSPAPCSSGWSTRWRSRFGVVSGFFMPAAEASLPRLLESEQLEGGNALMMGADQLAQFVGPALAGTVIALFGAVARRRAGGQPHRCGCGVRGRRGLVRRLGGDAPAHALAAGARRRAAIRWRPSAEGLRFALSRPGLPLAARPHRGREPAAHRPADRRHPRACPDALHARAPPRSAC